MKKITKAALLIGAGGVSIALAAPATASTERFVQRANEEMPFVVQQYGMPAVQSMGNQICVWESQGYTDTSELVDMTIARMPMSSTAAIQLKVLAEFHLGC
jgi:hypothetical protein